MRRFAAEEPIKGRGAIFDKTSKQIYCVSDMSDFIKKQKAFYKTLTPCYCQAIGETVRFTSDGLSHLLYKDRRPRFHDERHYRLNLINHLTTIITQATTATKTVAQDDPNCSFWTLKQEVIDNNGERMMVKVVLRKNGAGNVHFLSVMARRNKR